MLEMTLNGSKPIVAGSVTRTFLEDGDEIILKGRCSNGTKSLGFGLCSGVIHPCPFNTRQ
jgi:fumarylacetoacetase